MAERGTSALERVGSKAAVPSKPRVGSGRSDLGRGLSGREVALSRCPGKRFATSMHLTSVVKACHAILSSSTSRRAGRVDCGAPRALLGWFSLRDGASEMDASDREKRPW